MPWLDHWHGTLAFLHSLQTTFYTVRNKETHVQGKPRGLVLLGSTI